LFLIKRRQLLILITPYIIAVVNTKGGAGKSTLVINLAIAFCKLLGLRVLVVDIDDQASSINFFTRVREEERINAISLPPEKLNRDTCESLGQGYDIVLVDGKGSVDKATNNIMSRKAILASDFAIIPAIPSLLDDMAWEDFYDSVLTPVFEEGLTALGVLMSRTDSSASTKNFIKSYRESEKQVPLFTSAFPNRLPIKNATGRGKAIFEDAPKDKASLLFLDFFKELLSVTELPANTPKLTKTYNLAKGVINGKKRLYSTKKRKDSNRASKQKQ